MNTHNSKWWRLSYPSEWDCIPSRDDVRFVLKNGSDVRISLLMKQYGEVTLENLNDYASSNTAKGAGVSVVMGPLRGLAFNQDFSDGIYVCDNSLMLIILASYRSADHDQDQQSIYRVLDEIEVINNEPTK